MKKLAVLLALAFLLGLAHAQQASNHTGEIYLTCGADGDPDGVNDVYINTSTKMVTDAFGTSSLYREEGQWLVVEKMVESGGEKYAASVWKVNRFTLTFLSMSERLNYFKTGQCSIASKRI